MSYEETVKKLEDDIKQAIEREEAPAPEPEAAPVPEPAPEPEPTPAPEPEPEKPEPVAAAEYKERRQSRELRDQLEREQAARAALEARIAAMEKQAVAVPDKEVDPEAYRDFKTAELEKKLETVEKLTKAQLEESFRDKQKNAAIQEFTAYENQTRAQIKDYDDVRNFYIQQQLMAVKTLQPDISNADLETIVRDRLLTRAGQLLRSGYENPVAAMYDEAKRMGYKPASASPEPTEIKPDLAKVAANRARNAGTAGAMGGGDRGEITPAVAAGFTGAEWMKLKPEEKARIFAQLQG